MLAHMLRFSADWRTLVFISAYYVDLVLLWLYKPENPRYIVPAVLLTCVLSWIAAVITHNTLHTPVFKNRTLNRIFQVVLTCTYGFPVSEYIPGHNLSHHRFTQKRQDVMRTTKVRFSWNLLNFIAFFFSVAPGVTAANMRYAKTQKGRHRSWYRQFQLEIFAAWGTKLALLALDWKFCLLYIFVPHLYAVWGITTVNFLQHDGCDPDHEVNHSRNFVGKIFNWFTFNNGYHGMHHIEPGLHWSLLPKAHAEQVHPHIHPELEQRSLLFYMFKAFIWPGKRVRFDGQPLVLPEEGPDLEWIPKDGGAPESQLEQQLGAGA